MSELITPNLSLAVAVIGEVFLVLIVAVALARWIMPGERRPFTTAMLCRLLVAFGAVVGGLVGVAIALAFLGGLAVAAFAGTPQRAQR